MITEIMAFLIKNSGWVIWGLLYLFGFILYVVTKDDGGWRGLVSAWGHLTLLLGGWLSGKLFGILYISLPLLLLYYYAIFRLAEVVIPASDPENLREKFQRFKILAWYMWGMQFPIFAVDEHTGLAEKRIEGNAFRTTTGVPGYIWTNLYQVVGITFGTSFSRVEGPGAIYTAPYERPQEVIDLRTQLRTMSVDALTQDGIPIKAIVFAAFRVDRDPWMRDLYNRLKYLNPLLRGGMGLDCGSKPFLYSPSRVRAVLSIGGVRTTTTGAAGDSSLRWDEQVMNLIGEATRHVISEFPLSELWLPNSQKDGDGISALDIIAAEIRERIANTLRENGVQLFAARVVNYSSPNDKAGEVDEITRQQIPTWKARWEQKANQKLAQATADAEQKLLDASVLARSIFIATIAEGLRENKLEGHDINRYLIAVRFLSALDEVARHESDITSEKNGPTARERITYLRNILSQSKK